MKNIYKYLPLLIFLLIALIFYRWFTQSPIIGGDWPFLYDEQLKEYPLLVPAWNVWNNNGLGGTNPFYFLQTYQNITIFLSNITQIPWVIIYKIFWFGLAIIIGCISSFFLSKIVFPRQSLVFRLVTVLIYVANTYSLLLADGGQMGVLLAYSIAPLVVACFIRLCYKSKNLLDSILAGVVLSVQLMFDPRITYLILIAIGFYYVFYLLLSSQQIKKIFTSFFFILVLPGIIAVLLQATWILPYFFAKQNFATDFGETYSSIGIVKFLSFASFSQTLSLLHPNWPENIFGKVHFMNPTYLLLPIIGFSSILFLRNENNEGKRIAGMSTNIGIIYLLILGLIGAFLAKGASEPFGEVYLFLFQKIPGFVLFRDSTKFFLFTILSYSLLISYSLQKISEFRLQNLKLKRFNIYLPFIIFLSFLLFWSFSIRESILGQLKGTFKYHEIPKEYITLKNSLINEPEFFRTLWVPRQNRFSFYSNAHPAVEAVPLFNATNSAEIINMFKNSNTQEHLENLGIKYVIVPYDSLGELFQNDRKYDEKQYKDLIKKLESIPWLERENGYGKIAVFKTPYHKNHLYLEKSGTVSNTIISPSHYKVTVSTSSPQKLIFSESYNPYWVLKDGTTTINSGKTQENLNSFNLVNSGKYEYDLYFSQETYYNWGRIISYITLGIICIYLLIKKFLRG